MQVVQSGTVPSRYNGLRGGTGKVGAGQPFPRFVWETADKPVSRAVSAGGKSPSPAELYEQMTMTKSDAEEPIRSSAEVNGVTWTDELLATMLGIKSGVAISTEKPINWSSTGNSTLTAAQARELRKKYNLNNLSPQDHYNLMADLTNMNVLSAKDIHAMHVKTLPPNSVGKLTAVSGSPAERYSFLSGNIFKAIEQELQDALLQKKELLSGDYEDHYPEVSREARKDYLEYQYDRIKTMEKLQRVFEQISGAF